MTSCCADDLRFESVLRAGWGCRGRGRRRRGRRHRRAWRYPWWRQAWWLRGLRRGWRHNWGRRGRVRRGGRQGGQRRRPRPSRRAWWRWWRPGRVEIVPREAGWHVQRHGSLCGGRCEALEPPTTIWQLHEEGVLSATRTVLASGSVAGRLDRRLVLLLTRREGRGAHPQLCRGWDSTLRHASHVEVSGDDWHRCAARGSHGRGAWQAAPARSLPLPRRRPRGRHRTVKTSDPCRCKPSKRGG